MCGIAGIVSLGDRPVLPEEILGMCRAMVHRGPDDQGIIHIGSRVGLGMRRLSIIDLKTGRQPIRNEDGSIWVVFNGEIYNYRELFSELRGRGHSLYTATDTETIVHLYEEYGPLCVKKLRGMFAFALWDDRRKRLLLARDRLGIKPLYYAPIGERLIFASELKSILQIPEVERALNWRAVDHVFTFLTTPHAESIISGVQKLEPGHVLIASPERGVTLRRYWDVTFQPRYDLKEEDFVVHLRELLRESVRLHLLSDVPLGAFLSGGIDSSSVVAMMCRLSSSPVQTFSIGFSEGDYNELKYARLVAQRFRTVHQELVLEPNVLEMIDDLAWFLDEPFGDPSVIPTYMVSRLAAQDVKVVLSGDGGDELFAGYDKYLVESRERRLLRLLPSPVRLLFRACSSLMPEGVRGRNFLHHLSLPNPDRYLDAFTLFPQYQKEKLFQKEAYRLLGPGEARERLRTCLAGVNGHWLSAVQYLDLKAYLPLDILTKVDRMSMAHSLEARVPLLDHKVVEFAAQIPPELQLCGRTRKYIFRRALEGIVPEQILNRPKQGFAVPLGRWFRGQLHGFVHDLLLSKTSCCRGIFDAAYIRRLLHLQQQGRELDLQLWTLISFELWCRTFLKRAPKLSPQVQAEAGNCWRFSPPCPGGRARS